MHCNVNESTLTKKISWVLTNGLLSSKEVETGYGEDLGDNGSSTQNMSLHPLINVSVLRFKKRTSTEQKSCSLLGFKGF
jgi:hypothetical protein